MKINVFPIISDHFSTLYDKRSQRISKVDLLVFLVAPVGFAAAVTISCLRFSPEAYNASITFFGIFIALLLNIQVAIFGIFQRKWSLPDNDISKALIVEDARKRRTILAEINTNISYLTVFGTFSLLYFLFVFSFGLASGVSTGIASAIYFHFMATFLMVVKRANALFQKEYKDSPE